MTSEKNIVWFRTSRCYFFESLPLLRMVLAAEWHNDVCMVIRNGNGNPNPQWYIATSMYFLNLTLQYFSSDTMIIMCMWKTLCIYNTSGVGIEETRSSDELVLAVISTVVVFLVIFILTLIAGFACVYYIDSTALKAYDEKWCSHVCRNAVSSTTFEQGLA